MKTMRAAASYYIYPRARGRKVACPKLTGRACYNSAFADFSGGRPSRVRKVFFFESALDAMAFYQQKQEELFNIRNGLNFARKVLTTGECDMLILDEFLGILDQKIIGEEEFRNLFALREEYVDLVLTGKVCPPQQEAYADVVIKIENVKVDK